MSEQVLMADTLVLQDRLVAFVRAFGLHQPDQTPCGQLIPVSEAHALGELDRDGPLTQQELGARLQLEKSTVSRLVSQLASRGWLTRGKRGADARVWWVELTAPGRQAAGELAGARAAKFARLLGHIPAEQRQTVLDSLSILSEALHEHLAHDTR
jgi:DNA-binding MarR family transcriptional regulator